MSRTFRNISACRHVYSIGVGPGSKVTGGSAAEDEVSLVTDSSHRAPSHGGTRRAGERLPASVVPNNRQKSAAKMYARLTRFVSRHSMSLVMSSATVIVGPSKAQDRVAVRDVQSLSAFSELGTRRGRVYREEAELYSLYRHRKRRKILRP